MKVDGHLLIDLKNGDEKAFETLFWKYNEHVYHFIYSLLYEKSMAEDLTQNVFLKIWEKHETIDVEQNFDAYLFTIARNLVYKETENRLLSQKAYNDSYQMLIRLWKSELMRSLYGNILIA
mgnify:CR=1 FL=1